MVSVRRAGLQDARAIAHLTSEVQHLHNEALPHLFRTPSDDLFPAEKLEQLLASTDSTVAVAEAGGEILGCVYFTVMERPDSAFRRAETYIYLHQIAVRSDARGRGVGRALMSFVHRQAVAADVSAIQLEHWAFNSRARKFFERCGFAPTQIMMRQDLPPRNN